MFNFRNNLKYGQIITEDGRLLSWYNMLGYFLIENPTQTAELEIFLDVERGNNYVTRYKDYFISLLNELNKNIKSLETCEDYQAIYDFHNNLDLLINRFNNFCTEWAEKAPLTPEQVKKNYEFAIDNLKYNEMADGKGDALYLRNCNRNSH